MNAHSKIEAEERDAFISLARTQKRLSWVARGWARDAEERGDRAGYRSAIDEASRLWTAAKWHLERARDRNQK